MAGWHASRWWRRRRALFVDLRMSRPRSHEPAGGGRRLKQIGGQTRAGAMHWHASTIPRHACQFRLCRTRRFRARPLFAITTAAAADQRPSADLAARHLPRPIPAEEWIDIPIPPLVDRSVFEAARAQLEERPLRARQPGGARRSPG